MEVNPDIKIKEVKIHKPRIDSRDYKYFTLKNKLQVLLVHDKDADKAAAALDVNVGQLWDPITRQGLAHFCEHMLFLGSKKYPKEDEYKKYIE